MSRFFGQNSSSSSESESDQEERVEVSTKPTKQAATRIYESEEEEVKGRVVLSEMTKRSEEINGLLKHLKNAKKIRDIVKVNENFEEMTKAYEKCKKLIEKEGHFKQYIRALAELDTFVNETWADSEYRKSASKNNSTALSKLRQRLKKYLKDYETELTDFKEHPENYQEEEKVTAERKGKDSEDESGSESGSGSESDTSSESDSDDEAVKPKKPVKAPRKAKMDDDDDESDSDWTESDESSSSGDDIDFNPDRPWEQFIKKDTDKSKKDTRKETKDKKDKEKEKHKQRLRDRLAEEDDEAPAADKERVKLFTKDEDVNHANVVIKLNQICSGRGRKGTDRKEQIEQMNELREICIGFNLGLPIVLKIMLSQIAVNFDYNPRINKCMKSENWANCLNMIEEIISKLKTNENIEISDTVAEENEELAPNGDGKDQHFAIKGDLITVNDRLVHEYVKILQQCDAHGSEYVERLKDEPKICTVIDKLIELVEARGDNQDLCRIYLKKVEHVYYKYDAESAVAEVSAATMDRLCKFIYTNDATHRLRTKAMLCHIYHHALHDRWHAARDLMLMSHLQESIDQSDIPLQILYNRTMVQLGLCAFRCGNVREAHAALLDIQIGNRAKELLAQGMMVQRNVEKTKEQEMKERQRLIPFHMHINLELIECLYLVSAMLIEIPYMCSRDYETKKRLISKQFHYQLKFSERQPVVGPPENMREHVVAAARALRAGDWKACVAYLVNDKMNAKVWNLMSQSTNTKAMLAEKVKEEALRTYLFRFSGVYESVSIENLAEMFELPRHQVYSIISKMIINEELMASLDEPTKTVVMHRTEPTKIQTLALQLSEKITTLMDQTERTIQAKGGEMGTFIKGQGQQGYQGQHHQSGGYRGNNDYRQNRQNNYNQSGPRRNDNRERNDNRQNYGQIRHHNQHNNSNNYNNQDREDRPPRVERQPY